jgi:CheY-like chemotaxis protein
MKTILVADDFRSIKNFICDMLESKGYRTLGASNGEEAYRALLMNPGAIDLVLSDYNMPDCDGLGLLDLIKKHPQTAIVPVIFLTTENDPKKIKAAKERGVADWIKKPYRSEVFFATIEQVLHHYPIHKSNS